MRDETIVLNFCCPLKFLSFYSRKTFLLKFIRSSVHTHTHTLTHTLTHTHTHHAHTHTRTSDTHHAQVTANLSRHSQRCTLVRDLIRPFFCCTCQMGSIDIIKPMSTFLRLQHGGRAHDLKSGGCGFKSRRVLGFFLLLSSYFPSPVECPQSGP